MDSESSSSTAIDRAHGRTLDEIVASQKSQRKRFSVMFKQKSSNSLTESSEDSMGLSEKEKESLALMDVPVSETRSLRVKATRKVMKSSDIFPKEDSQPSLSELLGEFNPRHVSVRELKMKKGSER